MKAGRRGICVVDVPRSVFLRGQQDGSLQQSGVSPDRVRQADRDILSGCPADKRPENYGYGFPSMPGGQGLGRRGLKTSDDGRGGELPGEATGAGPMSGSWEGPSKGVAGYPLPNPTWRGKREAE